MKKKSIIILYIIIVIINILMPIIVQATSVNDLPETSDSTVNNNVNNSNDFFSSDITFEREYVSKEGDIMAHCVITPSTAENSESVPLIVWLHGDGGFGSGQGYFYGISTLFHNVVMNSDMKKFNAYILCPHAPEYWKNNGIYWYGNEAINSLSTLIEKFVKDKKNVDVNNIILAGDSRGAMGTTYIASKTEIMEKMPYEFSKIVVVSGFGLHGVDISNIKIPAIGYYGDHDDDATYFMKNIFAKRFECIQVKSDHNNATKTAYNLDENLNDCSDLIEWMFEGYEINENSGSSVNIYEDDSDKNAGGKLLVAIARLLCFLPDSVINLCQKKLVRDESIKAGDEYIIYYSPAIIFAGLVPAFDINFIDPGDDIKLSYNSDSFVQDKKQEFLTHLVKQDSWNGTIYKENLEIAKSKNNAKTISDDDSRTNAGVNATSSYKDIIYYEENNVLVVECFKKTQTGANIKYYYNKYTYPLNESNDFTEVKKTYTSIASQLQPTIATWYNALRRIALVGLLSVLVYIGIRIVLTSTSAKDKAKYKSMLKDWLVALCILFTLHYIMSIIVTVVEQINEIFKVSIIGDRGEDVLLTTLRNDIANGEYWSRVLVQVVIYFTLAIYTIIFTIQYFRRTIYLAFLTMIAPLITLTYPLDKIKDSKSQAFDMWIKDYIFFSLLQVVHLLIYYILVGSSLDLANANNWIFALVAIGFLIPAEKIIKKMFGFEKSKSMGALAAGATGALVMNAMNKIAPKSSGKKSGGSSKTKEGASSSNIRTTSNNVLTSLGGDQGAVGVGSGSASGNGWNGAKAVARKYGKKTIKGVAKGTAKGFSGATGAMIGFASGIAQGDISAALTGAVAGGKAGSSLVEAGKKTKKNNGNG